MYTKLVANGGTWSSWLNLIAAQSYQRHVFRLCQMGIPPQITRVPENHHGQNRQREQHRPRTRRANFADWPETNFQ